MKITTSYSTSRPGKRGKNLFSGLFKNRGLKLQPVRSESREHFKANLQKLFNVIDILYAEKELIEQKVLETNPMEPPMPVIPHFDTPETATGLGALHSITDRQYMNRIKTDMEHLTDEQLSGLFSWAKTKINNWTSKRDAAGKRRWFIGHTKQYKTDLQTPPTLEPTGYYNSDPQNADVSQFEDMDLFEFVPKYLTDETPDWGTAGAVTRNYDGTFNVQELDGSFYNAGSDERLAMNKSGRIVEFLNMLASTGQTQPTPTPTPVVPIYRENSILDFFKNPIVLGFTFVGGLMIMKKAKS